MSDKIVENLMEQIKGLARSDKNKFASYKSRNLRQQLSESAAVINAAAKLGIFPTIQVPIEHMDKVLLAAVGNAEDSMGKVLSFTSGYNPQMAGITNANNHSTTANTDTPASDLERNEVCDGEKVEAQPPTAANTLPTELEQIKKPSRPGLNWTEIAKSAGYGTVFFVCTLALVYLSAEAAGGGPWSYFWAILTEGGGIACIIHPARGWNKAGLLTLGLLCIALGYSTMLTTVFKKSDSDLTKTVSTDQNVKDLEEQIERSKKSVTDAEQLRDGLPATWVSKKREAQKGVDEKSRELTGLYSLLKAAREGASKTTNANIIGLWTGVEGARRFILLLFSIVVGHAFYRSCTKNTPKRHFSETH